jgi:hypothetical protein
MKTITLLGSLMLIAGSLLAADANPKDNLTAATKKLADQPNYSWKTTVVVPENSQFRPGPTEGQLEKDGLTHLSMTFRDNVTQVYLKGDKAVLTAPDGGWQSLAEIDSNQGQGRFLGMMIRGIKPPAEQATELLAGTKEIKKEGDVYSSDLTEDAAKTQLRFRRTGDGPAINNAAGSVKFWVKDGALTKFEYKVKGQVKFNDNAMDIDRTTTVEIKEVGSTKITMPEEAKKKM